MQFYMSNADVKTNRYFRGLIFKRTYALLLFFSFWKLKARKWMVENGSKIPIDKPKWLSVWYWKRNDGEKHHYKWTCREFAAGVSEYQE